MCSGVEVLWDNYLHQISPFTARMPYMLLPGNHERDYVGSGDRYTDANDSGEPQPHS